MTELRENIIQGGLLVYLSNTHEAAKVADLKNNEGAVAIAFFDGSDYQSGTGAINEKSISQVKITHDGESHYFKRVAAQGELKATAWIETDATGKALNGVCNATLCYGGYTGEFPPSTATEEGRDVLAVMNGGLNPQNAKVKAFTDKALSAIKTEGQIHSIDTYGHSAGASNAMLSNAITGKSYASKAVLVEPLKANDSAHAMAGQLGRLAPGVDLSAKNLTENTTSVFAESRDGSENSISSGLSDHKAYNIALGGGALQDPNKRTFLSKNYLGAGVGNEFSIDMDMAPQESKSKGGANMGELLLSMIGSLLTGQGSLIDVFASLLQGMPSLSQSGVKIADASTTQGPGHASAKTLTQEAQRF